MLQKRHNLLLKSSVCVIKTCSFLKYLCGKYAIYHNIYIVKNRRFAVSKYPKTKCVFITKCQSISIANQYDTEFTYTENVLQIE